MTISKKLRISSIIITLVVLLFITVTLFLTFKLQQLYQKQQLTEKVAETSFQMAILRSEYLTHPGERPKTQWINMYSVQTRLLDEGEHLFTATQEKELFEDTKKSLDNSRKLFGELTKNVESSGSATVIEELSNQLSVKSQTGVSNVLSLAESSHQDATTAVQEFKFVTIMLAVIILVISMWSYLISRSIAASLKTLDEGTRIISSGNLEYQLEIKSNDELGLLSRSFNTMAAKLRESYSGLGQRVRERTQELENKTADLERINKVMVGRELKMAELKKEIEDLKKGRG